MASRKSMSTQTRFSVLSRDRFTCRYCSRSAPDVELHVDHVVPVALGGSDDLENLVAACVECNLGKSDKTIDGCPPAANEAKATKHHPLRGMGFLSFKDGKVHEQGLIENVIENATGSLAIVVYFEWIGGGETYRRLIPVADFAINESPQAGQRTYRLFASNEDRNNYYEWKGGSFETGAI